MTLPLAPELGNCTSLGNQRRSVSRRLEIALCLATCMKGTRSQNRAAFNVSASVLYKVSITSHSLHSKVCKFMGADFLSFFFLVARI